MNPIDILDAIPASAWTAIGHVATYVLVGLAVLYSVLSLLCRIDLRDGKLDHPKVREALDAVIVLLSYLVAVLEMLPVRLPVIDGVRRFQKITEGGS